MAVTSVPGITDRVWTNMDVTGYGPGMAVTGCVLGIAMTGYGPDMAVTRYGLGMTDRLRAGDMGRIWM